MSKSKLRILTLVGTRPELIKLSRVIHELDIYCEQILVHTGQNFDFELNQIFFDELEIRKPDYFLDAAGGNPAQTIGNVITKIEDVIVKTKPDAFIVYGDTNSCLAVITAKRHKVPIFHMEAGNRCFDQRVPEEINRKIVDHLSDINMVHSEHARRYLLNEGLRPDMIFKTGSPMPEILNHFKDKISASNVLDTLSLKEKDYFIISLHREENIDSNKNFNEILKTLDSLADKYGKRIIFSTHPRTRKKLESLSYKNEKIEFMKPLGFFDYIQLQKKSFCTISDSGTITEESSILKFPAITIRQAHERPEGVDQTAVLMSDLHFEAVERAVELATGTGFISEDIEDYSSNDFSQKVVRIIHSYVDFVNQVIWKK